MVAIKYNNTSLTLVHAFFIQLSKMINFSLSFVLVSSVTGWQNEDQAATVGHVHTAVEWLEKESSFSTTLSSEGREEINAKCLRRTGVAFWTESNGVEVNMSVADISQSVFQETGIPRVHPISPNQNVWILRQAREG